MVKIKRVPPVSVVGSRNGKLTMYPKSKNAGGWSRQRLAEAREIVEAALRHVSKEGK